MVDALKSFVDEDGIEELEKGQWTITSMDPWRSSNHLYLDRTEKSDVSSY